MNGISALVKDMPESSLDPSVISEHSKRQMFLNKKVGSHQVSNQLGSTSATSQPSELLLFSHPVYGNVL